MIKLNHLLRDNATLEARKQLLQNFDQIKESFDFYDPYIQGVLIQAVIYLSQSEFEKISKDYFQLLEKVKTDPKSEEWVRRKAFEFSEYPKIKIDDDMQRNFDISPLRSLLLGNSDSVNDQVDNGENNNDSNQMLDPLFDDIQAPSVRYEPPVKVRREQQRVQPRTAVESGLAIPSAPKPKPNNTLSYRPNDQNKYRPYEKKKDKKQKDIKELPPDFI